MPDVPLDTTAADPDPYERTLLGQFDRRFLRRPVVRGALGLLLLAALIAPSVQFCHRIQQIDTSLFRGEGQRHRTALGRWMPTLALAFQGPHAENPYGYGHWFPTPTTVWLAMAPLARLGYLGAAVVWSIAKIAGFLLAMAYCVSALRAGGRAVPVGVLLAAAAFSIRPVISDIQHGNLNMFMMIWLALAWGSFMRGRDIAAGVFTALAIVTKITPALLLVYFIYKRRWKLATAAAVALVVFVLVVPGLLIGFGHNVDLLHTWFDMLVRPFAVEGYATLEIANQSLYGTVLRLAENAGIMSLDHMPAQQALQVGMADMARPATAPGRLLRPAMSLVVIAALAWLCRTPVWREARPAAADGPRSARAGAAHRDLARWLEFVVVLIAMLLLSERTWKHHATTLPLVYLAVWMALVTVEWTDRFRAWFVAGLVVQLFLLVIGSEGLLGDDLAEHMLDGGVFCWGLVLCGAQAGILLYRMRRRVDCY